MSEQFQKFHDRMNRVSKVSARMNKICSWHFYAMVLLMCIQIFFGIARTGSGLTMWCLLGVVIVALSALYQIEKHSKIVHDIFDEKT